MMRGTVRLGAIGLAIGLMCMAMAPTNARALTPISIFDFKPFPKNVVDDTTLPDRGVVVAANGNGSQVSSMPFDNGLEQVSSQLGSPSFGLIVAAQRLGFEVLPFSTGNDGGLPENSGESNSVVDTPVGGPNGSGAPPNVGGDTVTTAPEPATWLMMIAGFWIVAWRLRHRRQGSDGPIPLPA